MGKFDFNYSVVSSTVQQSVYQQLHDSIVNLELKPGTVISTNDIAEKLCASRTPVREAFLMLKSEGLLDINPQRPTVVSLIDLDRVYQERFVRAALELKNIRLFAQGIAKEDITSLSSILENMKQAMDSDDTIGMIQTDNEFHEYMLNATKQYLAESIINRMNGHYSRMRLVSLQESGIREDVYAEHEKILKVLASGDVDNAYDILYSHLNTLDTQEEKLVAKWPSYFRKKVTKKR